MILERFKSGLILAEAERELLLESVGPLVFLQQLERLALVIQTDPVRDADLRPGHEPHLVLTQMQKDPSALDFLEQFPELMVIEENRAVFIVLVRLSSLELVHGVVLLVVHVEDGIGLLDRGEMAGENNGLLLHHLDALLLLLIRLRVSLHVVLYHRDIGYLVLVDERSGVELEDMLCQDTAAVDGGDFAVSFD